MRAYAALSPTDQIPHGPDTVYTLLIAGSSGQALDWSTAAQLVRFSGQTTAGVAMNFYVSLNSTRAAAPSSGSATGTTAGALPSIPVHGSRTLQVPPGSTGWSAAALSSGYISAEVWKK